MRGARLWKCTNSFLKKNPGTSWPAGRRLGLAARPPGLCRQSVGPKVGPPARGPPGALGRAWFCPAAQTTAWARGCCAGTVNPPSKVSKSFPLALADLCGLELIIDRESERTQPLPCGGATTLGQVAEGLGRGWWEIRGVCSWV